MKKPVFLLALLVLLLVFRVGFPAFSLAEGEAGDGPFLQLNPAEVSLQKGRTVKVTPSVVNAVKGSLRGIKYEWTSSDSQVAVFQYGSVKALGAGSAVLTCTASLADGTVLTADCPVTVTVAVTGIRAAEQKLSVMEGDVFSPEFQVLPEDATNQNVLLTSSDERILSVGDGGKVTALSAGKAVLTAVPEDSPSRKVTVSVTVAERVGITDKELTFLGIPWESNCETVMRILKEKGVVAEEARIRCSYTGSAWHWPENDLLFSRISAWRSLPVSLSDRQTGAGRTSIALLKTIGGYLPQTATLVYLGDGNGEDAIDQDTARLIGVYFQFDNRHAKGSVIFCELLGRLEAQYGTFTRYLCKDIPKYYQDLYKEIAPVMAGAREYALQEPGLDVYLGEYAICTLYGGGNTGIMLNMDTNETVTLFYGRTDASALIRDLEEHIVAENPAILEDVGV